MNVRRVSSGVDGRERAVDEVDKVLGGDGTPAVLISAITDNGCVYVVVVEGRRFERLVRCVIALEVLVELQGLNLLSTPYSSEYLAEMGEVGVGHGKAGTYTPAGRSCDTALDGPWVVGAISDEVVQAASDLSGEVMVSEWTLVNGIED